MCRHGMRVRVVDGEDSLVYKPTGWLSNSSIVLEELSKQCTNVPGNPNNHQHANLQNGRAKSAAIYPEGLCYAILRGVRRQMVALGVAHAGEIGAVCEDIDEHKFIQEIIHNTSEFYDDINGKPLDSKLVQEARAEEIAGACKHGVWNKVPIAECLQRIGRAPIGTRWVDINKGDSSNLIYRSRLVGREFKGHDHRDDLFAATPPLEAIRALISLAASQRGLKGPIKKLSFIDVSKAYFHAPVKRDVYVMLPDEALEPHERGKVCGKVAYSLYGTRDAAQNWEEEYTRTLVSMGFIRGLSSPCIFHHRDRDMSCVVHGDDFTVLAEESSLHWFASEFKSVSKSGLGEF